MTDLNSNSWIHIHKKPTNTYKLLFVSSNISICYPVFFYGDRVNIIQIQTWEVLIANQLSTFISRMIKRHVSFSQRVKMPRITVMYQTDIISFMKIHRMINS